MDLGLGEPSKVIPKGFTQLLPNDKQAAKDHRLDEGPLEVVAEGVPELGPCVTGPRLQRPEPSVGYPLQGEGKHLAMVAYPPPLASMVRAYERTNSSWSE